MKDEIVEQVRRARDEFAARFNYDLRAMGTYLIAKQSKTKNRVAPQHSKKVVRIRKRRKPLKKAA